MKWQTDGHNQLLNLHICMQCSNLGGHKQLLCINLWNRLLTHACTMHTHTHTHTHSHSHLTQDVMEWALCQRSTFVSPFDWIEWISKKKKKNLTVV